MKIPDEPKSHTLVRIGEAVSALVLLIVIGTIAYHNFENWTWIQSFYFSVTTLTTVGYGDLHPTSDASRLFTAFYILAGVGVTLAALSILGSGYIDRRTRQMMRNNEQKRHE